MQHEKLDYLEFPSKNLEITKKFFQATFNWQFTDYGPDYTAFANEGLEGGFYSSDLVVSSEAGSVLVVFFSQDLEATQNKIEKNAGTIAKPIFSFPGGRRFHFCDPNGNEYAVWSDS